MIYLTFKGMGSQRVEPVTCLTPILKFPRWIWNCVCDKIFAIRDALQCGHVGNESMNASSESTWKYKRVPPSQEESLRVPKNSTVDDRQGDCIPHARLGSAELLVWPRHELGTS